SADPAGNSATSPATSSAAASFLVTDTTLPSIISVSESCSVTSVSVIFSIQTSQSHMTPLKTQAIQIALTGNWEKAAQLNIEILKENPEDTEALNRLAFALAALGNNKEAKEAYDRVLIIDPLNPIAQRGLKRINTSSGYKTVTPSHLISNMF